LLPGKPDTDSVGLALLTLFRLAAYLHRRYQREKRCPRKLVVQSVSEQRLTLDELLRVVTDQNLHGEWDSGPAVGREIW
jgi:hypothetical protein